jgi:hypothetical protein
MDLVKLTWIGEMPAELDELRFGKPQSFRGADGQIITLSYTGKSGSRTFTDLTNSTLYVVHFYDYETREIGLIETSRKEVNQLALNTLYSESSGVSG